MGSCSFWFPAILANKYCCCCCVFSLIYLYLLLSVVCLLSVFSEQKDFKCAEAGLIGVSGEFKE